MNTQMHGKKIARIIWTGENLWHSDIAADGEFKTLELSATFHGDHDEFWVIEREYGKEIARHNCRNISTIVWAEPTND